MSRTYRIAEEFSPTPGGRFKRNGPWSGEAFRDDVLQGLLRDAVEAGDRLTVILDGASGYGSSFLEEAFGGLIRRKMFTGKQVKQHLVIQAQDSLYETYRLSAERYMSAA